MALARIITRSDQCSRQLAFDLLARGYTVEIVSPDKIPDNLADLELRVDTGPGDRLAATVEAHNGGRSASLEFVHYLKAPMGGFIRRPLEPAEVVPGPEPPACVASGLAPAGTGQSPVTTRTRFNAEPRVAEVRITESRITESRIIEPLPQDIGLPEGAPQLAPEIVATAADVPVARDLDSDLDSEDAAHLTAPREPVPAPPVEPPSYFAVADSTVSPASAPPTGPRLARLLRRRDRSLAWRWRTALTFAGVVLLAAILGFGIRRTGKAAAQSSGAAPVEKVAAASTEMPFPGAADFEKDPGKDPGRASVLASAPSAVKSEGKSGHAPKAAPVAKAATATATHRVGTSRTHSDDLIARNTVTYLDPRFKPRPVNKSAAKVKTAKSPVRRRPSMRKHGGVIAANQVTYLHKPSPTAPK